MKDAANRSPSRGLQPGLPMKFVFPFFLVHMLAFGASGFFLAYGMDEPDLTFVFMHGGIAILVYLVFYLVIFGPGTVGWMFVNAGLGLLGIIAQIDFILRLFGRRVDDFSFAFHIVPFTYYVLYTFLLYQAVLWLAGVHTHPQRRRWVEAVYVVGSVVVYGALYFASP